jgi:hypothetical protein
VLSDTGDQHDIGCTYGIPLVTPFFSARPSVGEVFAADLLILDAAGVS